MNLKPPKTAAGRRRIRVSAETLTALAAHRSRMKVERRDVTDGPVFVSRAGKLIWRRNLSVIFHRLIRLAGVPVIRPNGLRHTSATLLLAAGASVRAVSRRLGHTDIAMTLRHYARFLPDDDDRLAALAGDILRLSHDGPTATDQ